MRTYFFYIVFGLPAIILISLLIFVGFQPIQVIPRRSLGPGFGLVDTTNTPINNETMRGKLVLYSFSYTRCGEPCEAVLDKVAETWQAVNGMELGDIPVEFVTITLDPRYARCAG